MIVRTINFNPQTDDFPPPLTGDHTLEDYVTVPDFGPQVVVRLPAVYWDGKLLPQKVFCFRHGWEIEDVPGLIQEPEEDHYAEV